MTEHVNDSLALVGAVAGGLVAVGYLVSRLRRAGRMLDAIDAVVHRELNHNHGSSMKDDLHGIALAVGQLQRRVDVLEANNPRRRGFLP